MLRTQPDKGGISSAGGIGSNVNAVSYLGPIIGTTAFVAIKEGEVRAAALYAEINASDEVGKLSLSKEVEALVIHATQGATS